MRVGSSQSYYQHDEEEENISLVRKGKGKGKNIFRGGVTSKGEKKKDMNKFRCYTCNQFRHYVGRCKNEKNIRRRRRDKRHNQLR